MWQLGLRVARLIVVIVLSIQGSGVGQLIAAATADECCAPCEGEDEGDGERCPPLCPTCACGHARRPTIVALPSQPAPKSTAVLPRLTDIRSMPDSPDPRSIFHPPRA
jgi:hypothetical protein